MTAKELRPQQPSVGGAGRDSKYNNEYILKSDSKFL
jgi:hypothetical protein